MEKAALSRGNFWGLTRPNWRCEWLPPFASGIQPRDFGQKTTIPPQILQANVLDVIYPFFLPGSLMRSSEEGTGAHSGTRRELQDAQAQGALEPRLNSRPGPTGYVTLGTVDNVPHPHEVRPPGPPERATWSHCHFLLLPGSWDARTNMHVLVSKRPACFKPRRPFEHGISKMTINQLRIEVPRLFSSV